MTQIKQPPTNPGRFIIKAYARTTKGLFPFSGEKYRV